MTGNNYPVQWIWELRQSKTQLVIKEETHGLLFLVLTDV